MDKTHAGDRKIAVYTRRGTFDIFDHRIGTSRREQFECCDQRRHVPRGAEDYDQRIID